MSGLPNAFVYPWHFLQQLLNTSASKLHRCGTGQRQNYSWNRSTMCSTLWRVSEWVSGPWVMGQGHISRLGQKMDMSRTRGVWTKVGQTLALQYPEIVQLLSRWRVTRRQMEKLWSSIFVQVLSSVFSANLSRVRWQNEGKNWISRTDTGFDEVKGLILKTNAGHR